MRGESQTRDFFGGFCLSASHLAAAVLLSALSSLGKNRFVASMKHMAGSGRALLGLTLLGSTLLLPGPAAGLPSTLHSRAGPGGLGCCEEC